MPVFLSDNIPILIDLPLEKDFVDVGVGKYRGRVNKQVHYFGQLQHRARDAKAYHSSDYTDGIDFFVNGHDKEEPIKALRSKNIMTGEQAYESKLREKHIWKPDAICVFRTASTNRSLLAL